MLEYLSLWLWLMLCSTLQYLGRVNRNNVKEYSYYGAREGYFGYRKFQTFLLHWVSYATMKWDVVWQLILIPLIFYDNYSKYRICLMKQNLQYSLIFMWFTSSGNLKLAKPTLHIISHAMINTQFLCVYTSFMILNYMF